MRPDISLVRLFSNSVASTYAQIMNANDLVQTFTYADPGTADERMTQIVSSSASLGRTVTETLAYAGVAGSYRVSSRSRVVL